MSNDLISRNSVIAIIENKRLMVGKHDLSAEYKLAGIQEKIENLPAAYDVDKVCRKINENKDMDNLIDADHAIKIVKSRECSEWLEAVADELESPAKPKWIPAEEPPKNDKYILLSFENFSVPQVGRYEEDQGGGAYYLGDEEKSCISQDLIVNAWMPLPKAYRDDEKEIFEYGQSNEKAGSVSRNAKTAADIDQAIEYFKDEISQMDVFSDIVHFQEKERKSIETALWALQKVQETIQGQQDGRSQCATSHG